MDGLQNNGAVDGDANRLRELVLSELGDAGFEHRQGLIAVDGDASKRDVRMLHAKQRMQVLRAHEPFIAKWEDRVLAHFADGDEVDPAQIAPEVVMVEDNEQAAIFRYATLFWSVPVSQGYGRRTRFLVMDRSNHRLIGIFALGDPVYNLSARDTLIGWKHEQRSERLYNVLDAFVLGAVSPYRELIGGKLVAMTAVSDQTMEHIRAKYSGRVTQIRSEVKEPRPVLVTTTSALGRSSIYNRIRYGDRRLFESVGFTQGWGHFQFSDELSRELRAFIEERGKFEGHQYGDGPNYRIRMLRVALTEIGLDPKLLRHGIRRQVFLAPVARNWRRYLRGETDRPRWYKNDLDGMGAFFRRRWAVPRSKRDDSFAGVTKDRYRVSRLLERTLYEIG